MPAILARIRRKPVVVSVCKLARTNIVGWLHARISFRSQQ
jgi:hypothetical protein